MTTKFDSNGDERTRKKDKAFVDAISFGLAEALDICGITLLGFAVKYDAWECLLTLKADIGGTRSVAFVGSNSVVNAILSSVSRAENDRLRWRKDHYKPSAT